MEAHRNAVIYVRVSTAAQVSNADANNSGPGIKAQCEVCLEQYKRLFPDRQTPTIVSEVGSTFNNQDKLVELDNLIENMGEKTLIIVHDVSRLGRNVYQTFKKVYEQVELKKSFIYSTLDERTFGVRRLDDIEFFRKSVDAEAESTLRSELCTRRLKIIRENGGYVGGTPFGKKLQRNSDGYMELVNDNKTKNIVRKILNLHRKEKMKLCEIKRKLASDGITNNGRVIGHSLIKRILDENSVDSLTKNMENTNVRSQTDNTEPVRSQVDRSLSEPVNVRSQVDRSLSDPVNVRSQMRGSRSSTDNMIQMLQNVLIERSNNVQVERSQVETRHASKKSRMAEQEYPPLEYRGKSRAEPEYPPLQARQSSRQTRAEPEYPPLQARQSSRQTRAEPEYPPLEYRQSSRKSRMTEAERIEEEENAMRYGERSRSRH